MNQESSPYNNINALARSSWKSLPCLAVGCVLHEHNNDTTEERAPRFEFRLSEEFEFTLTRWLSGCQFAFSTREAPRSSSRLFHPAVRSQPPNPIFQFKQNGTVVYAYTPAMMAPNSCSSRIDAKTKSGVSSCRSDRANQHLTERDWLHKPENKFKVKRQSEKEQARPKFKFQGLTRPRNGHQDSNPEGRKKASPP